MQLQEQLEDLEAEVGTLKVMLEQSRKWNKEAMTQNEEYQNKLQDDQEQIKALKDIVSEQEAIITTLNQNKQELQQSGLDSKIGQDFMRLSNTN